MTNAKRFSLLTTLSVIILSATTQALTSVPTTGESWRLPLIIGLCLIILGVALAIVMVATKKKRRR